MLLQASLSENNICNLASLMMQIFCESVDGVVDHSKHLNCNSNHFSNWLFQTLACPEVDLSSSTSRGVESPAMGYSLIREQAHQNVHWDSEFGLAGK